MGTIDDELATYPSLLAPLTAAATRYAKYPSALAKTGVLSIGHRPWVAEQNYMIILYPGIQQDALDNYSRKFKIKIPECYVEVLRAVNGVFCFGMSLCGVPLSMLGNPPVLDRTKLQCHDLATAATRRVREYRVPNDLFHFGGRHLSYSENVGYFIDKSNRIKCVKNNGETIGQWPDFTQFLSVEIQESEKLEEELHPAQWQ